MKQEDAKKGIFPIWHQLPNEKKYGDHCGFELYGWLKNNREDLLSFQFRDGDKSQLINGWVTTWQHTHPQS